MRGFRLHHIARAGEISRCYQVTEQWLSLTLGYLGLRPVRLPLQVSLRSGGCVSVGDQGDLGAFWQVFVRRIYGVVPSDRVIVDAGANIGMFTLYAALAAPHAKIVAVEPFPRSHARLLECIQRNCIGSRVRTVAAALGGDNGKALMDGSPGMQSQSRRVADIGAKPAALVEVDSMTLDTACGDLGEIDLLKMDVEGAEYVVLGASSLRSIKRIVVEYHEVNVALGFSKRTLFSDLASKGFRFIWDSSPQSPNGVAEFRR